MLGKYYLLIMLLALMCQDLSAQTMKLSVDSSLTFETLVLEEDDELNRSFSKRRFIEDSQGNMWVCTELGLYRIDGFNAFNFSKYLRSHFPALKMPKDVWDFQITDSLIWLGTKKGLFYYDRILQGCHKLVLDTPFYKENYRNFIYKMRQVDDFLYLQTRNGLYVVDVNSKKVIKKYFTKGERNKNPKKTNNVALGFYTTIADSTIWVQTYQGLHEVNKKTGKQNLYEAPFAKKNGHPFYQGVVIGNDIIMPTYFYGLAYFNTKSKKFSQVKVDPFNDPNNTRPNNLKAAVQINKNTLLIGNEIFGLLSYDVNTRKFVSLNTRDGIAHCLSFDSKGNIWYGLSGIIQHSQQSMVANKGAKHNLSISSIWSRNNKIAIPGIESHKKLQLDEQQENIIVNFSITQSYYLDSLRFQYQFDDMEWQSVEKGHSFYLENIKHGSHQLLIRAFSNDKQVDEMVYSFSLEVPLYKRLWFILLSFVLIILGVFVTYRVRIKKLKRQQEERIEFEKQIAELENTVLRNQMNPHFMFNSINSIKGLIINEAAEAAADQLTRFSKLMRSTLNYSAEKSISLSQEIEFIKTYSELERFKGKNPVELSFEVEASMEADNTLIIPFLLQPFVENAFKHAFHNMENRTPKIAISFKQGNKMLIVEIEDNGSGVKDENASVHVSKGTELVEKRLELHNKEKDNVSINFKGKDNGTKVTFKIRT